jgi:hypothetical protein
METFTKFLYDFLSQFFSGLLLVGQAIGKGFCQTFNIPAYADIINQYKGSLSAPEWALTILAIGIIMFVIIMFIGLIILVVKKYGKVRQKNRWI